MLRIDSGFARLSLLINQTSQRPLKHQTGRELTMADFMVYVDDIQPKGLTLEAAAKALGAKRGR